jgi:hypothetical protein
MDKIAAPPAEEKPSARIPVPSAGASADNGEKTADEKAEELRYVTLKKPIRCGDKVLNKLLCDPVELSGDDYFRLLARFRDEDYAAFATSINKVSEPFMLGLILAELNQIAVEDIRKMTFKDTTRSFQRVQNFLWGQD